LNGGNYANTDANGNFIFSSLTADKYILTLMVDHTQYVATDGVYEQTITLSDGQSVTNANFNLTGANQTTTPGGTATTTVPPTGGGSSGVVAGFLTIAGTGLNGGSVSLILRGNGAADSVAATTSIDSSGHYFFSNVPATTSNQFYLVSYANSNPSSGILALWNSNPFALAGGATYFVPTSDVADVNIGLPGANDLAIKLPYNFSWTARNGSDNYSLSFFPGSNTSGGNETGTLGNVTEYTLTAGTLNPGDYYGRINLVNSTGTGASNQLFHFQIVTTLATATPTRIVSRATATPKVNQQAFEPSATPVTATATVSGDQGGGVSPTTTQATQPTTEIAPTLPPGVSSTGNGGSLPTTGGELPIVGLALAVLTLFERRIRLFWQRRRAS
jgi:hypothetical protein